MSGYRIGCRLGEGGGGEVFLGVRDGSDRMLAIKLLDRRFGSGSTAPRAWRELDILSQLHLPAIPRVIDYGRHEGRMYIATEYINGQTLDQHCGTGFQPRQANHGADARTQDPGSGTQDSGPSTQNATQHSAPSTQHGPLDLRARVALLARVADAVQTLHEHGIIHRDLKPANILVDQHGDPMIIDLGLATLISGDPMLTVTAEGIPLGSPAYMAPEQARGERSNISTRTDVYGLGATAYAVLTGRTPHDTGGSGGAPLRGGPSRHGAQGTPSLRDGPSFTEIIHRVATAPPTDPRAIDPRLPKPLAAVLLKAVSPRPADRYASAAALAADLRRWLEGEAVLAQPPSGWQRSVRWLGRHPIAATATLAAAMTLMSVSLAASLIYAWWVNTAFDRFDIEAPVATLPANGVATGTVRARSESDRVLAEWPYQQLATPPYAKEIPGPAKFGGRVCVTGFTSPTGNEPWNSQCCVWRVGEFVKPIWWSPGDRPMQDPIRPEPASYLTRHVLDADVFPNLPGLELIVIQRHHHYEFNNIRVYDLEGHVLFEAWHSGTIVEAPQWLDAVGLLVFAGSSNLTKWQALGYTGGDSATFRPHPCGIFAVRPHPGQFLGYLDSSQPNAANLYEWQKFPHVAPEYDRRTEPISLRPTQSPADRGRSVRVELPFLQEPKPGISWVISPDGTVSEGSPNDHAGALGEEMLKQFRLEDRPQKWTP